VALLARLKASGVRLSMDDFGTGYSSLSALRHFPGDELKIDRSFVKALSEDAAGEPIVAAIVALSQALNLLVIAEGIETDSDARRVRDLGCDRAQGYHLARPMAPERLAEWLQGRRLLASS
jgi:EAL domain-containing protein (putative c-di-GMP-specific phosphodiesterase class I)